MFCFYMSLYYVVVWNINEVEGILFSKCAASKEILQFLNKFYNRFDVPGSREGFMRGWKNVAPYLDPS